MIEIQIHPSDIRRKVRYYFFGRRSVQLLLACLVFFLTSVLISMTAAPSVIRRAYKTNYVRAMRHEQKVQAERLREHVQQMEALEKLLSENQVRIEKLLTIYGIQESTAGQGGLSLPIRSRASEETNDQLDAARKREIHLKRMVERLGRQLEVLARYESANAEIVRHTPSVLPLPVDQFVLTSPFGNRVSPFTRTSDFHKGIDLAAPTGTSVFSTADGVVTFSGRYPLSASASWWRFGNVVVISHADRFFTIYAHCDTTLVRRGQIVKQGDAIATVGSSGWSTNSHLHYEIRTDIEKAGDFQPVDPRIYILNYQWNNEERILIRKRRSKDYRDFDPLPSAFLGRRRA